jgi:hypothetical protein
MKKFYASWTPVCLFLAFLVIAGLPACQSAGKKAGEKAMEAAIEKSSGENAEVDIEGEKVTIQGEDYKAEVNAGGSEWPDEIPDDIPEFSYGSIEGTTTTETDDMRGWGINFRDVPSDAVDKYESALKSRGFKTVKVTMDEGGTVGGEKGNFSVSVISGKDMTHVGIQVKK